MARNFFFLLISFIMPCFSFSQDKIDKDVIKKVDKQVVKLMDEGNIPGLSLVIIKRDQWAIRVYGYSNSENKKRVTPNTLFQLGSCTKAFTALAVQKVAQAGLIHLNAYVSDYLPWFKATYKDSVVKITLLQLLHHTSGIPWQTIAAIPESNSKDALEQTIKKISGVELHNLPGKKFEYATINYDIIALIIEKVTGQAFEDFLQRNVLNVLQLHHTTVGMPVDSNVMSTGYKIGFFKAREYKAPLFKGNNAAGYVISNANDMVRWLQFHLGLIHSDIYDLLTVTHKRDETVPLHDMSSYAMGWDVSLSGNKEIYHSGLNPNYTTYIAMRPDEQLGVAVLANSNSNYTSIIGDRIMKLLAGEKLEKELNAGDGGDKSFSLVSFIIGCYTLVVLGFLGKVKIDIVRKRRKYGRAFLSKLAKVTISFVAVFPFLYGLYLLPMAIAGFTWDSIMVWTPISFATMVVLAFAALGISYFTYFVDLLFPEQNKFKRKIPLIVLMSILSGISNMVIIILVTSALNNDIKLRYIIFYYIVAMLVYLLGRWYVQINLIRLTRDLIYELRIKLIEKIFSTSYQKFEKIDRGRIYTALNDDVDIIGNSTNMFVMMITSIITAAGAFLCLASIAFWATMMTAFLIIALAAIYYFVSKSTNKYYNEARSATTVFMRLINSMIDGFKEISLHRNKKLAFKNDVADTANEYREKISIADIRFVNAFLVGESLLIVLLGVVAFAVPKLFPSLSSNTIMSFVIVLLYLIGPINGILNSTPAILQLKIAWGRVQQFLKEIPANMDLKIIPEPLKKNIESIQAAGITFQYQSDNEHDIFSIGPIDIEVKKGEILFIIGGNGSGKTTLAKLLTGLYEPKEGKMMINGEVVERYQLSEYFSTVFNPAYLFETLYDIDLKDRSDEVKKLIQLFNLEEKIQITENKYSTINLSGGQRKRLALLQCYLEDCPIYLFDEWAADQDPDYRNFFYRTLLPAMKSSGKIVIAITHDDHYFDIADNVLKMEQGKIQVYTRKHSQTFQSS